MKSGKQRRTEIKQARRKRIEKLNKGKILDQFSGPIPNWAIAVDRAAIVHHSYYIDIPLYYLDREFQCKDCGSDEVWTAKQQKWWYEIAKGDFETSAVHCRPCRKKRNQSKAEQKAHMEAMAKKRPHPNEAFFKKGFIKE
ncbi:zinc-ribbon domain-containing protein [uncultured Microbulbifer sp.]|uniref:zinc-ribbon domain-containing protein n=1 Tax=uncultured Microbulbifer sp. TaxID=348147 RepID=UPI002619BB34|nr:zinc-ribbon domain-containing protein [uncultured Microbulbifer sp.]